LENAAPAGLNRWGGGEGKENILSENPREVVKSRLETRRKKSRERDDSVE